jgi:hypothetical protein
MRAAPLELAAHLLVLPSSQVAPILFVMERSKAKRHLIPHTYDL